MENAEINSIIKILGLSYKKKYETEEDLKTLRFVPLCFRREGSLMGGLMCSGTGS